MRSSTEIPTSGRLVEWLLAGIVFLLPWQARWIYRPAYLNGAFWEYGSLSLYATELLVWTCLVLVAVEIFFYRREPLPRPTLRKFLSSVGAVFVGAAGLVLVAWVSIAWASDRTVAWQAAFRLTEAVALFFTLLLASPTAQQRARIAWVGAAALQGVLAAVQFFGQHVSGSGWFGVAPQWAGELGTSVVELADGRWLRAYGTFPHPNILAGFLAVGLVLAAGWYVQEYQRIQRVMALGCGLLSGIGLVVTFSRSGFAGAMLGWFAFLAMLVFSRRQSLKPLLRFSGFAASAMAAIAVVAFPQVFTRTAAVGRLEVKSFTERRALVRQWGVLSRQSWPLGVGIGNATVAAFRTDPSLPGWGYQPVHSVWLLASVELGIAGAGVLAIFWFGFVWRAVATANAPAIAVAVAMLALGLADHYLWSLLPGIMVLWVGLALGLSAGARSS